MYVFSFILKFTSGTFTCADECRFGQCSDKTPQRATMKNGNCACECPSEPPTGISVFSFVISRSVA